MCGFAGYIGAETCHQSSFDILTRMSDSITHRGPDDSGIWVSNDLSVGLAHRRLSVVDLSPSGHQPMHSPSGRYVMVYNGEIYNHHMLRNLLNAESSFTPALWRGQSDTETLLFAFEMWGIEATLLQATGMFAFAVWDTAKHSLTLGRDRMGEKPLYYGWQGSTFLFGSELKALKQHPAFAADLNREALGLYMRLSYIPAPMSIYTGIFKLIPGTLLSVSLIDRKLHQHTYWSLNKVALEGVSRPFLGNVTQASWILEGLLETSIKQQMLADVPLGAFLSGGVDSSTIVSLMQKHSMQPVKTFSVGFELGNYNEAHYAKAVATHLGTDHTELYVTADQAISVIPRLPSLYDEPFADSSQIPTFLVAQLARQYVTVSLSGDAGDELFCGYNRYIVTNQMWKSLSRLPVAMRKIVSRMLLSLSPTAWDNMVRMTGSSRFVNAGDKIHKGANAMASRSLNELYRRLVSHTDSPEKVVLLAPESDSWVLNSGNSIESFSSIQWMMFWDMFSYLPDDILVKVDRAAMGVSLETRVPFLDHRVVEFSWQLPLELNLKNKQGKQVLREVLYRYTPRSLIERPKMGFGIPLDMWLRGPLREWAETLLEESILSRQGFLDAAVVSQLWQSHLSGKRNVAGLLWNILMFQAWLVESDRVTVP